MMKKTYFIFIIFALFFLNACTPKINVKESQNKESGKVTITLASNFEGGDSCIIVLEKDSEIKLPAIGTLWQRDGYSFLGWSASNTSDEISYFDKASFTALFDHTLYAVWKKIVNIKYDANGGKGKIETQTFLYGDTIKIEDGNLFKNGDYIFACWNTMSDGSGDNIEIGTEYSDYLNMTLYAKWIKIDSALTMDIAEYDYQNYAFVSDCNEYAIDVIIPEFYKGYKVTKIGSHAFEDCVKLKSCYIPNTVKLIGSYAFYNCSNLTSIYIPNSVNTIGGFSFSNCSNLTDVVLSNSITSIESNTFSFCTSLMSIEIPYRVTSIGALAFYGCNSLGSIEIPDSVETIGFSSFSGCFNLSNVSLSNQLVSVESALFYNCSSLTSIKIPDSVKLIDKYAFQGCTSLKSVNISYGLNYVGDYAFSECLSLEEIILPDSITDVGPAIFYKCSNLKSVSISKNIESLPCVEKGGIGFFRGCTSLVSVNLPLKLNTISNYCFMECTSLKLINMEKNVSKIGTYAFYGCADKLTISYNSLINNWEKIILEDGWTTSSFTTIECNDGVLNL